MAVFTVLYTSGIWTQEIIFYLVLNSKYGMHQFFLQSLTDALGIL